MDILTLGKMNQMAKDVDQTLEFLANATFETLKDICNTQADIEIFQTSQVTVVEDAVTTGTQEIQDVIDSGLSSGGGAGTTFYVSSQNKDGDYNDQNYGGCCNLWAVPADTTEIRFELYGAGSSSMGACCCGAAWPGGSGAYAVKTIKEEDGAFNVGDTYSICSGGTGCCWPGRGGCRGHTSYVNGSGLSNLCAMGGKESNGFICHGPWSCYQCCQTCFACACAYGSDMNVKGQSSWMKNTQGCGQRYFGWAPGGSGPLGNNGAFQGDACNHATHSGGRANFPGGGGVVHNVGGGPCCCGRWGAGGLVVVTYW
jgi:hypothetical protein